MPTGLTRWAPLHVPTRAYLLRPSVLNFFISRTLYSFHSEKTVWKSTSPVVALETSTRSVCAVHKVSQFSSRKGHCMAVEFFNRNIPDECHQKMRDFASSGNDIAWVAFPPGGGNRWSVVSKSGAFFNRNIPDECHQKMQDLSANGAKIVCVAFPPQGGNSWSVVNDKGAFFNRNIPDEAHMYMGYFSEVYGPVRIVAFDMDGNGWSVTSAVTKHEIVFFFSLFGRPPGVSLFPSAPHK